MVIQWSSQTHRYDFLSATLRAIRTRIINDDSVFIVIMLGISFYDKVAAENKRWVNQRNSFVELKFHNCFVTGNGKEIFSDDRIEQTC